MSTLIFRDTLFLEHSPGPGHPENPYRLAALYRRLDAQPIPGTVSRAPRPASLPELRRVHDPGYLEVVAATAGRPRVVLDPDTATGPRSYEAALHAAGAVIEAAESVVAGSADGAFALVRPPGHHAEANAARGFCLFNNVAAAAAHAVESLGCRRVLILDPDVHHGNGTQHRFWRDPRVLYISSHRYPFYPGTGWFDETGDGPGNGYTINLPMPPELGDAEFLHLYESIAGPVVAQFQPELILVSAGFDTWQHDPIGRMKMTEAGYAALFGLFKRWADACCPGRIVLALEGGYDPVGIAAGVEGALGVLTGAIPTGAGLDLPVDASAIGIARNARATLAPYWSSLRSSSERSR